MKRIYLIFLYLLNSTYLFSIEYADMIINEVYFKQAQNGTDNDEFIEFYATKAGTIKDYIFTDQDGRNHQYIFEDISVNAGDYVVLNIGKGTDVINGNVKYLYMNRSQILNNDNDDILLLKPSDSDTTEVDGITLNAIPVDYIAYGRNNAGDNTDAIPLSNNGVTISWDYSNGSNLSINNAGYSISLTLNGVDHDTSQDWERTTSSNTIDHDNRVINDTNLITSIGYTNNGIPDIKLSKTTRIINDPINNTTNPKAIPKAIVENTITVTNEGTGSTDHNTTIITQNIAQNTKLCVADTTKCKKLYFTDDINNKSGFNGIVAIEYSNNNSATYAYTPTADTNGFDSSITNIRVKMDGAFNKSEGINHPAFQLKLRFGVI